MHEPKSIQENEAYKIIWEFEIQTENPIPSRVPDLMMISKKKAKKKKREDEPYSVICHPIGLQSKSNERQVLGPCSRTKKDMEHEGDVNSNFYWCACNCPQ